jgi:radical SAM superfamily enzyme YgiQ (UPF0313 family)
MSTRHVLLVYVNPIQFPPAYPYALTILGHVLTTYRLEFEITEPFAFENPIEQFKRTCERVRPRVIAFSLRNLDTARHHFDSDGDKTFIAELIALVKAVRGLDCVLALGGSGFSIAPVEILEATSADLGFVGASEMDFAKFCQRLILSNETSIAEAVRDLPSAVILGSAARLPAAGPLGSTLVPDRLAKEYVELRGGSIPLRTKSGCSMKCSYCVVPSIEHLVLRPWSEIRSELQLIVDGKYEKSVFIADGEFNLPSVERAIDLCRKIKSEFGTAIQWACYLEAGYVTAELLTCMREAGCIFISLTVDSFSRETRIGFIKGTKPEVAIEAAELCLKSQIRTDINLLFGGPNETLVTAETSARIAKDFSVRGISISVSVGLRVYPGTPLFMMARKPKFAPYYTSSNEFDWLGVFCSPIPAKELTSHILQALPRSPAVVYTEKLDINRAFKQRK